MIQISFIKGRGRGKAKAKQADASTKDDGAANPNAGAKSVRPAYGRMARVTEVNSSGKDLLVKMGTFSF